MKRTRLAATLLALAVSLSGCAVAETIQPMTGIDVPLPPSPVLPVDPPDALLASDAVVAEAAHSVVRIHSTAPGCQKILEGSGVVIAANRVMTSAHVVAGAESFSVSVDGGEHDGTVVLFDPDNDIAILDVPGLQSSPLTFVEEEARSGTDALVMGYPGGGPFVATPARIREVIELSGPDIYHTTTVHRDVYVIRGKIGQGDSGGPLIDRHGRVLGINFGAAVDDPDTGFVLTAKEVYPQRVASTGSSQPVATGACFS
jgi:S1-C subfamily serine protease